LYLNPAPPDAVSIAIYKSHKKGSHKKAQKGTKKEKEILTPCF